MGRFKTAPFQKPMGISGQPTRLGHIPTELVQQWPSLISISCSGLSKQAQAVQQLRSQGWNFASAPRVYPILNHIFNMRYDMFQGVWK